MHVQLVSLLISQLYSPLNVETSSAKVTCAHLGAWQKPALWATSTAWLKESWLPLQMKSHLYVIKITHPAFWQMCWWVLDHYLISIFFTFRVSPCNIYNKKKKSEAPFHDTVQCQNSSKMPPAFTYSNNNQES